MKAWCRAEICEERSQLTTHTYNVDNGLAEKLYTNEEFETPTVDVPPVSATRIV